MARGEDRRMVRAIVHVRRPTRFAGVRTTTSNTVETRLHLVASLKATADRTQAPLHAYLEEQQTAGYVSAYEPFWSTNAIAVRARPFVIRALAAHPSVVAVRLDHWRQWIGEDVPVSRAPMSKLASAAGQREGEAQDPSAVEWNVTHVRADEVWHALHITGTGAVVAGMDTGVDWLHPALRSTYRSHTPHGPVDHGSSWFDATEGGALYPVDGHGHGTHTLGTILGGEGVGVAPGARWIAVRVLNNQGYGYDSWIHAGFQWLMAPGDDPLRAPDVVNCSWGNANGYLTTFQDDLRALRAAGVLVVFASGNHGPGRQSVGSPASLPEAFAVGAADSYDEVASFSARGPSPWGEIRPHVVAPGVQIRSSVPGGGYASMQGTSMAAPHASGVAAVLRAVSPTLSITHTVNLITSTAVALGDRVPNNDTGWGRVDAFAAVVSLAQPGFIRGTVRHSPDPGSGAHVPIAGARVTATAHGRGGGGTDITAQDGTYQLALAPGNYDLKASAFAYEPSTKWGVTVVSGTTAMRNFALAPKPTGKVRIQVKDASSQQLVSATIAVLGTPYQVITHTQTFDLPADRYTVRAHRVGFRVITRTVSVDVGATTDISLALPRAPSILLVDSGGWYYESQVKYYRQALDDLSYAYDEWPIRDVRADVPLATDLAPYDIVVWSAPRDAPGYIGAGDAVAEYLEDDGRLILSGQDVGFWDDAGSGHTWSPYYEQYLKVGFVDDDAPSRVLTGEGGDIFSGQTLTIAGPGGADNQDHPEVITVIDSDAATPVIRYQNGGCGGVRVGTCLDYRVLYLPFGFEAITERADRREVMRRSLDFLVSSPPRVGLEIKPETRLGIGPPGSRVAHTVRLRHTGQGGDVDQIRLMVQNASWHTELSASSLTLSPCESATMTISVTIPTTATRDMRDLVTLIARSSLSPTVTASATLETKAPAPILLVDDDRWYDQQMTYTAAMEGAGLSYDLWETSSVGGGHGIGPAAEMLQRYPVVVWWTGYDWYAPVTREEAASLEAYLNGGGRLMLSSQDFLYHHRDETLAYTHLGVLTYTESVTPTHVQGVTESLVGADLGPWPLQYPPGYKNWSDAVVPGWDVGVALRDQKRRGVALARRAENEATLFLTFPFEALPAAERSAVMERSVGWLSWLGTSSFGVQPRSAKQGETVTYTLTVHNDGPEVVTTAVSNQLPAGLEAEPGSFIGPGTYDASEGRLSWRGAVHPAGTMTFTYQAVVLTDTIRGGSIVNTARIELEDHIIGFGRSAMLRLAAPDLSRSAFACLPFTVRPGRPSTCTLTLRNTGSVDASVATARIYPPGQFNPETGSLGSSSGLPQWTGDALTWSGPLIVGQASTLTFRLKAPTDPMPRTLYGVAFLEDGVGGRWERSDWLLVRPSQAYLPFVSRFD